MAVSRLFIGVALTCLIPAACGGPQAKQPAVKVQEQMITPPSSTTTTTVTPPPATTTTSSLPPAGTSVHLLDDAKWWAASFPEYPLDATITLRTAEERFGSLEAQQLAITDGFTGGLRRASAPATPPPGMFSQATLYFDAFGGSAQALDAVNQIFLKTDALGPLSTVKIESRGQTVFIWKPNNNPGLDLFYAGLNLGADVLSVYAQGTNLDDAQIHQVASLMTDALNAASAQAGSP